MRVDRIVALALLAFCTGYGVLAWNYPLLPFERQVSFRPNTMPLGLAVTGIVLSLAVIVFPGGTSGLSSDARGWRNFDWRVAAGIVALMLLYAGTIRPLGYIFATAFFLVSGAVLLGERKFHILIPVAVFAAASTWYLVQEGLGVFLKPLPTFWG